MKRFNELYESIINDLELNLAQSNASINSEKEKEKLNKNNETDDKNDDKSPKVINK